MGRAQWRFHPVDGSLSFGSGQGGSPRSRSDDHQPGPHLAPHPNPDQRIWLKADWSSLNRLGVDETSTRKGHKYGTVFLEISGKETDRRFGASKVARLLFFTPGKDKETFTEFAAELERRGVPASQKSRKSPWTCPRRLLPEPRGISPRRNSA